MPGIVVLGPVLKLRNCSIRPIFFMLFMLLILLQKVFATDSHQSTAGHASIVPI